MAFCVHQHETGIGIQMSPPSYTPLPLPSLSVPLGYHKDLALGPCIIRPTSTGYLICGNT